VDLGLPLFSDKAIYWMCPQNWEPQRQQKKPTSSCSGEVAEHRAYLLETLADLDDEFAEVGPGERKGMLLAIECLPVPSSTSLALRQFNLSRIAE
jgi:hypothetical protein